MLTFSFTGSLNATYNALKGMVQGAGTLSRTISMKLTDGTAAGQADGLFTADTGVKAGSVDDYLLSAGLRDLYGDQVQFSAVKVLWLEADLSNTTDIVLGGGSWIGPFSDPSHSIRVKPGSSLRLDTTDANGWLVDPAADMLQITSAADALYKLTIVGVSAALSAPAAALHPELIGTPRVGTEVFCTAGNFSGNPVQSYQWRRAGSVIPGAAGASYVPVVADLAKQLVRVTTLANIAGSITVTTAPVTVQAAGGGADGVLDFSQPGNPLAAAVL